MSDPIEDGVRVVGAAGLHTRSELKSRPAGRPSWNGSEGDVVLNRALEPGFKVPSVALGGVLETLGTKLFTRERTLIQYAAWSVQAGLFELLGRRDSISVADAVDETPLTECGADSLLGILCALGFVRRLSDGRYQIESGIGDYFLAGSPYFIGDQLEPVGHPIPPRYLRGKSSAWANVSLRLVRLQPLFRHGSIQRLENQHVRNLAPGVAAVKTGEFSGVQRIVDIAGGSGTFSIPFALEYPEKQVVLTDLPRAAKNMPAMLKKHGLQSRVQLMALDVFDYPWRLPPCDGIFIGNFLHGFSDEACAKLCRESFERLPTGGRLWLHEMVWNENRDGPLITAMWHAAMRSVGSGSQKTAGELTQLLQASGFTDIRSVETLKPFWLLSGRKPN